jgi:opacity protein-like surface antigen
MWGFAIPQTHRRKMKGISMKKIMISAICFSCLLALASGGRASDEVGSTAMGSAQESVNPLASLLSLNLSYEKDAMSGDETKPDSWSFRFEAYFWAADLDGTLGVKGLSTSVDASFSDIWDNLDIALQGHFEMEKGKWVLFFDATYIKLEADGVGPKGLVSAEIEQLMYIVELGGGYRVWETRYGEPRSDGTGNHARLDILGGGRYMRMEMDLDLAVGGAPSASVDGNEWWLDPFVGARISWSPLKRFETFMRADIGGFGVASDFAWNATAGVSVQLMDRLALLAGYRILDVDYEDDGFTYDAQMRGPWLAVMLDF